MLFAASGDNCVDYYEPMGKAYPGGNPVNVAVYWVRLGEKASYVGVVGDDKYGDLIHDSLKEKGVDISHIRRVHGRTAVAKVELINGERRFGDYFEGVLENFKLTDEEIEFLRNQDIVHTALWGKLENDLHRIKGGRAQISFDFADKLNHSIVDKALPSVDYAFFSYTDDDDYIRNYIKTAHSKGPKVVVATLGANGSIAYDGEKYYKHGIIHVDVVDTMGAGDSYIAGFMRGIVYGKGIEKSMELGAENAAETLKYNGAW